MGDVGNDNIGTTIKKRLENLGVDTQKIYLREKPTRVFNLIIDVKALPKLTYNCSKDSPKTGKSTWYENSIEDIKYCYNEVNNDDVVILDGVDEFSLKIIEKFKCDKILDIGNDKRSIKIKRRTNFYFKK